MRLRNVQRADATSELYVVRRDGTRLRRLTHGSRDFSFAWSPDGGSIAFVRSARGGASAPQVDVIRRDGGGLRRFVRGAAWSMAPAWSPDGGALAFAGGVGGLGEGVFVADRNGGNLRLVFEAPATLDAATVVALHDLTDLQWSPDGTRLLFELQDWIYVLRLADGGTVRLPARGYTPKWSPDSRGIAFVQICRLAVIGDDGSGLPADAFQCAQPGNVVSAPSWSPDGAQIVAGDCRLGGCRIFVVGSKRGAAAAGRTIGFGFSPSWSPDGGLIAYVRPTAGGRAVVYVMRPNGTHARPLSARAR
jgi:Tol biopolymer transport system component